MNGKKVLRDVLCVVVCVTWLWCLPPSAVAQQGGQVATVVAEPAGVRWQPRIGYGRLLLTVSGPDGKVFRQEFGRGQLPTFNVINEKGTRRADGQYTYELRVIPVVPMGVSAAVREARERGEDGATDEALQKSGRQRSQPLVQSGSFTISNGAVVTAAVESPQSPNSVADFLIDDDLIVVGSTCTGLDCVEGESFGFDTLRLKENNLRIHFDDTSVGSFPKNDWRITVNESGSGEASKFSIDDVTGAKTPFTILAGAPANSLFVSNTGRLGLRTATPFLDIHMVTGDTPAVRFEQNASGGFPPQTWDVAGNEANFFVRDVSGGSRLPFRIRPGAPTSSIDIAADGNVGIGVVGASFKLDVAGTIRSSMGGFMFPDGTTQTTAAGTISAANVSSGSFGQNTGGGHYTFPNRLGVGTTATPAARLQVDTGDVYITDNTKGIIMKSPNGTCRRVTLTDAGTLQVSAVIGCP